MLERQKARPQFGGRASLLASTSEGTGLTTAWVRFFLLVYTNEQGKRAQ